MRFVYKAQITYMISFYDTFSRLRCFIHLYIRRHMYMNSMPASPPKKSMMTSTVLEVRSEYICIVSSMTAVHSTARGTAVLLLRSSSKRMTNSSAPSNAYSEKCAAFLMKNPRRLQGQTGRVSASISRLFRRSFRAYLRGCRRNYSR